MARTAITMLLALLAALCAPAPAAAHSPVVSKLADTDDGLCDTDCSLREAIDDALGGETITFAEEVVGTSTLSLGALLIDGTTAIAGPGREKLTISGGDAQRIFRITTTGNLTASGLTFAHAKGEYYAPLGSAAGGVVLNSGSFDITDCAFIDNHADGRTGTVNNDAAAIYSDAANKTIALTRCTFERNTAAAGACLDIDGGRLIIRDSTFTGNISSLGRDLGRDRQQPGPGDHHRLDLQRQLVHDRGRALGVRLRGSDGRELHVQPEQRRAVRRRHLRLVLAEHERRDAVGEQRVHGQEPVRGGRRRADRDQHDLRGHDLQLRRHRHDHLARQQPRQRRHLPPLRPGRPASTRRPSSRRSPTTAARRRRWP